MKESRIYVWNEVENKDRKFGSVTKYQQVWVMDGEWKPALFTKRQISDAINRAAANPEDIAPRGWFTKLKVWLGGE